jgi:hypothetical protein
MQETAQYFEKLFFINRTWISYTVQNFMPQFEIMKLCQIHWYTGTQSARLSLQSSKLAHPQASVARPLGLN